MLRNFLVKITGLLLALIILGGCATSTMVRVHATEADGRPVNDATVSINGEVIGQTPNAQVRISNFVGTNTQVTVTKEGYNTVRADLEKEVKAANVVSGILLNFFAWLWVYGPKPVQEVII